MEPVRINRKKILFVCTANRMRSATAFEIYKADTRLEVKAAGTAEDAPQQITENLLAWPDAIVVMERQHRNWIRKYYPTVYEKTKIVCLYIPDEYDYMQEELIRMLKAKFEDVYHLGLL